jgi:GNAT superfamily N-acetyltransferase
MTSTLPAGFHARAGSLDDYLLAFELSNAFFMHVSGSVDVNDPELVRLDWQNAGFHPETDLWLVFAPDGRLVGLAEAWMTHLPPVHPWNWVCVHPDYFDRGLWEYLLEWAENRSMSALERVPAGLRFAPHTGTEHTNEYGLRAIQSLGWKYNRSFYRMFTELDAEPLVPPTPDGIVIRTYHPETETEAVYLALVDAFKDHFGFTEQPFESGFAEFKHNLIDEPGYDPNYWFLAMDGDEIAGVCLCRPESMEDATCGFVNELGVRRAWRKRGLGTILLKHAFAAFYVRGQKSAALGVDASSLTGATRLYERAGMRAVRQFDNFEKELRPGREISTQVLE